MVTPVCRQETASRKSPVRFRNVDAPEKGKSVSAKATEALSKLIKGEEVRIDTVSCDKYGRAVANVYLGRESVNKKVQKKLKQ